MCLLLLSYRMHPLYPLIVAANRDEFYDRPTSSADFWEEAPEVLGGRDLKEGGAWMGITRKGRFAALTNYRNPLLVKAGAPSRGWLVRDYLQTSESPESYLQKLEARADRYNSFSLVFGDCHRLLCYSNRCSCQELSAGIYGLSNCLIDVPWPKVDKGKEALRLISEKHERLAPEDIFAILYDRTCPEDDRLPDTGVGTERERMLAPVFIESPDYGTRSSTALIVNRNGWATFAERSFDNRPEPWMTTQFKFRISSGRGCFKGGKSV